MKIAIIGKANQLYWLENTVDAFQRLGHQVLPIKYNQLGLLTDIKRNILKKIHKEKSLQINIDFIEKQLSLFRPDIILVISPLLLPSVFSESILQFDKSVKIAWVGDKFSKSNQDLLSNYDHVFFTDSGFFEFIEGYESISCSYLPLAVNEKIFFKKNNERHNYLLFIGSSTPERNEVVGQLSKNVDLRLIGNRWKKRLPDEVIKKTVIGSKKLNIFEVANEYNQANFVLNIKHEKNVINGLNMRTFEVMACGCCLIQDYVKDLDLFFEPGKELFIYNEPEEVIDIWGRLIRDKKEMQGVQRLASANVLERHTYVHRANSMLDIL